jgi:hypothetical protein
MVIQALVSTIRCRQSMKIDRMIHINNYQTMPPAISGHIHSRKHAQFKQDRQGYHDHLHIFTSDKQDCLMQKCPASLRTSESNSGFRNSRNEAPPDSISNYPPLNHVGQNRIPISNYFSNFYNSPEAAVLPR